MGKNTSKAFINRNYSSFTNKYPLGSSTYFPVIN